MIDISLVPQQVRKMQMNPSSWVTMCSSSMLLRDNNERMAVVISKSVRPTFCVDWWLRLIAQHLSGVELIGTFSNMLLLPHVWIKYHKLWSNCNACMEVALVSLCLVCTMKKITSSVNDIISTTQKHLKITKLMQVRVNRHYW